MLASVLALVAVAVLGHDWALVLGVGMGLFVAVTGIPVFLWLGPRIADRFAAGAGAMRVPAPPAGDAPGRSERATVGRLIDALHADELGRRLDAIRELPGLAKQPRDVELVVSVLTESVRRWSQQTGSEDSGQLDVREAIATVAELVGTHRQAGSSELATPALEVNLSDARLPGMKFGPWNLMGARLTGADLRGARFATTDLSYAWLAGADLQGALFESTDLSGASLMGANLRGALFRDADLRGADLAQSRLEGTDLSGARLKDSHLAGATYDLATRWPRDLDPQAHGAVQQ